MSSGGLAAPAGGRWMVLFSEVRSSVVPGVDPPEPDVEFERWVRQQAAEHPYPPTPGRHRLAPGSHSSAALGSGIWRASYRFGLAIVILAAALLAVPSVRAAVLEWIQVGGVRIFFPGTARETGLEIPSLIAPSMLDLAGETGLNEAAEKAGFPVLLPAYPNSLGQPDRVHFQTLEGGPAVILIWLDPEQTDRIQLSLLQLGPNTFVAKDGFSVSKGGPIGLTETQVGENRAFWLEGTHLLILYRADEVEPTGVEVASNVLLWEADGVTYRLESDLPIEQAVEIAESLR